MVQRYSIPHQFCFSSALCHIAQKCLICPTANLIGCKYKPGKWHDLSWVLLTGWLQHKETESSATETCLLMVWQHVKWSSVGSFVGKLDFEKFLSLHYNNLLNWKCNQSFKAFGPTLQPCSSDFSAWLSKPENERNIQVQMWPELYPFRCKASLLWE